MKPGTRVFLVLACVLCLVVLASALPAADPRLDVPGIQESEDDDPPAGEWESIVGEPVPAAEMADTDTEDSDEPDDGELIVRGDPEPGSNVTVVVPDVRFTESVDIYVDGEEMDGVSRGRVELRVPFAEQMTIEVPDRDLETTVDIRTDATIQPHDGAVPDGEMELSAAVGTTPLTDATVTRDGDPVERTDWEGRATIDLPREPGPIEIGVERGPVTATQTITVPEPEVSFTSPVLVPGSPASVQVSADGERVSEAVVEVVDGAGTVTHTTETDDDGIALVWLPIDDEVTVMTQVGAATGSTTVSNLYWRLGAILVLVPGLLIGGTITYLRYAARRDDSPAPLAGVFAAIAAALDYVAEAVQMLRPSLPHPSSFGLAWLSLQPFRRLDVRLPSLGGLLGGLRFHRSADSAGLTGRLLRALRRSADDSAGTADQGTGPTASAGPRGPRAELRAVWLAVCDRVDVRNRETSTPGEVARTARTAGFPTTSVRELLAVVRDIEYGGSEPTTTRIEQARVAAREVLEYDPDGEPASDDDGRRSADGSGVSGR